MNLRGQIISLTWCGARDIKNCKKSKQKYFLRLGLDSKLQAAMTIEW